jgi:hypothetical protein
MFRVRKVQEVEEQLISFSRMSANGVMCWPSGHTGTGTIVLETSFIL